MLLAFLKIFAPLAKDVRSIPCVGASLGSSLWLRYTCDLCRLFFIIFFPNA